MNYGLPDKLLGFIGWFTICLMSVLLFCAVASGVSAVLSEPAPIVATNWHPGFIEVEVEIIDPPATWFPPTSIDKASLQTVLVNTDHIITIGIYRGHTKKTPRYALLLSNDLMLIVSHDYEDLVKLIRASWVGAGKKA